MTELKTKYPTTLEYDLERLENENLSFNLQNCLKLRIGEKRIIENYLNIAKEMRDLFVDDGKVRMK